MKKFVCLLFLILALALVAAATFTRQETGMPNHVQDLAREQQWVDSLFHAMTPDERLGQLIWLRAHTDLGSEHEAHLEKLIRKYQPGGLCFFNPSFKGTPQKQVELTNRYQALTKHVPLFMTIDGEWGLGMRYKENALSFPRQMTLGAIQDNTLLYRMGVEIARHCRRVGLNVNFAPVADVNNNAANPVINFRSFGEDPRNVAAKAYQYMKGMQDNGVLACAKHFPGHGDTDTDSHYDLPLIRHSPARLDSVELFPFRILIEQGVGSIMVAHLSIPALDDSPNVPTTLSRPVVTGLLKEKMGFSGLVMTDALEMKGVTKYHGKGEAEARALAAGNDVLLLPADVDAAFKTIREWMAFPALEPTAGQPNTLQPRPRLDPARLDASVKKVLRWKYRMGLTTFSPLDTANVYAAVNDNQAKAIKRLLIQNALTLVRNKDQLLPFRQNSGLASLAIGAPAGNVFQKTLTRYASIEVLTSSRDIPAAASKKLLERLKGKDAVVVSLHAMSQFASKDFGLTQSTKTFIEALRRVTRVVLVVFGNPYSLRYFDEVDWVLEAYEEDDDVQELAAQALFGAFPLLGKLPVTASERSPAGTGIATPSLQRLGFGLPEEVGMSSARLLRVDTLVQEAIDSGATPGCVVLVAKNGKVVFEKAYGHHTYEKNAPPTQSTDIFDLASITKIAASAVSLMKLQEEGRFSVQDPVEKHLPEFKGTNKEGISFLDLLTHRARLVPWIKFYEKTVSPGGKPLPAYFDSQPSGRFPLPVAKNLWLRADYPDSIWLSIRESPLEAVKEYKYSDLGFYIAGEAVRRISGQSIENYVQETFYQALGLQTMTYRPFEKFPLSRIPPTEEDDYFRDRRIQGYVHDMGAAMLNQTTGHAGLFSNAYDLAVLMQMLLNKGWYGGRQFLLPETIHFYTTRCSECTRRGIAFDMFQKNDRFEPNLSTLASHDTFGHLGFTGTAVWADPRHDLVYVFLSNRTFPTMRNNKLGKMNTRARVQDAVYEAILKE